MALIQFEDLPSTETPLNSANLNNNFNELQTETGNLTTRIQELQQSLTSLQESMENLVTSGDNSNGRWIKYSDGTMICTKKVTLTTAINSSYGSLYESSTLELGNLPETFVDIPIVSATQVSTNGTWVETIWATSTNYAGKCFLVRPTKLDTAKIHYVEIVAIGRWK